MQNRIKDIYALVAIITLLMVVLFSPSGYASNAIIGEKQSDSNAWRFRVFLDDREIGYHHFYLDSSGEIRTLRSEASFEYRLLFVKLFHYEHENLETWSGDCLQSIRSKTDANGRDYFVEGSREAMGFRVQNTEGSLALPECVMSFAYWNPDFLEQSRLLNTQDGTFLDVEITPPVPDQKIVHGQPVTAYRYSLDAGDFNVDLWYSANEEWLALESAVQGGRTLRYEPF